ncbi:MAG: hypothetical protein ABH824_06885 [Nanoarchaeota archaeon]|nr:hypothetical protein [Nanoarchaeota archaeon]MBU1631680.1 hypothetical protein [Nanoarchaeota archaeon]MBU1876258.1 hypothetical protein [Nanoarchaeota archaeon]
MSKKNHLVMLLYVLIILSLTLSVTALVENSKQVSVTKSISVTAEKDCIYYFYGQECDGCQPLDSYFIGLKKKFPELKIEIYEVYHNAENFALLQSLFNAYNVDKDRKFVPVVFTHNSYFIGAQSITSLLDDWIKDNKDLSCPSTEGNKAVGIVGKGSPYNVLNILNFFKVTGEAIRNVFTPGIIALSLLFLVVISILKERENLLKGGVAYIAGVYLAYLLFSMGLFTVLYQSEIYHLFYRGIGLIAVIFGLMGVNTFFGWKKFLNNLPNDLHKLLKSIYNFIFSFFGVLVIGFLSGLLTFASVGETFILMRSLFVGGFRRWQVFPLLLYYILIIILIFVVLLLLFRWIKRLLEEHAKKMKDTSDNDRKKWEKHYLKVFYLSIRIIILILGLILLFV